MKVPGTSIPRRVTTPKVTKPKAPSKSLFPRVPKLPKKNTRDYTKPTLLSFGDTGLTGQS